MTKYLPVLLVFSLLSTTYHSVNANEVDNNKNNKVLIALNLNDCTNCVNNLRYLFNLNNEIGVVFVLPEKYKIDSIAVKESLNLSNSNYSWIWSDSLNKNLMFNGKYSSIIFIFKDSKKMIKYDLKSDLKEPLVAYFNKMSNLISDTFIFKEPILNSGTGKVLNVGTQIFTLDKTQNSISGFSMINREKEFSIKLTDSLMKIAFLTKFNTIEEFEHNLNMIKSLKLIRDRNIKAFDVNNNQISVLASYTFFRVFKPMSKSIEDTFELKFDVVHEFDLNGKYLATFDVQPITVDYTSEEFLYDPKRFDKSYYGISSLSIKIISKDVVLMNVMRKFDVDQNNNKFAAYFKKTLTDPFNLIVFIQKIYL